MFRQIGVAVIRRPRFILALAGVAVVLAAVFGIHAPGKLQGAGFVSPNAPSQLAANRLKANFGGSPNLIFLVTARSPAGAGTPSGYAVDSPSVTAAGRGLTSRLESYPGVGQVSSYWAGPSEGSPGLRSHDGSSALVMATIEGSDKTVVSRSKAIIQQLSVGPGAGGSVTVRAGGSAGTNYALNNQIGKDLALAEGIAIPLTLLLLVLAFGSVVSGLLPVAIGLVSILGTLAALFVIGSITSVSIYALNMTTAMGLGLGIDYALLMVSRYREELAGGLSSTDAIRRTIDTSGRTIVFSAATVAAALAVLTVFPVYFLRSFAYAGVSVLVISVVAALFVLPALLAVLGPRVNSWAVRSGERMGRAESPFWRRVATAVVRRPAITALPVVAALLVLGIPFLHVHFGTPDDRVLPTSSPARQVGDALRGSFATNANNTLDVVVTPALTEQDAAAYSRDLSSLRGVAQVNSPAGVWARGSQVSPPSVASAHFASPGATWISAVITPDPLSGAAQSLVHQARSLPPPAGSTSVIGGQAASFVDQKHDLGTRLPLALLLIALTTFIVLFLFTGSVLLPLKALLLNTISLSAVFGMIVWVFQYGHLSSILGFTPTPTNTVMPLLLFCIAFGLSMDYEVFVLSRIIELHKSGVGNNEAIAGGLARSGRIVSMAAALLAVTFFAFGLGKVSFIKMFGLGTGLAILIDATFIRGVVVPAFMRVAGNANWWAPRPLRRLHDRIGLSDEVHPPAGVGVGA